jgi:hypothetical protein
MKSWHNYDKSGDGTVRSETHNLINPASNKEDLLCSERSLLLYVLEGW